MRLRGRMADPLRPYLEKLLEDIEKDVERFRAKSNAALFLKPIAEWTEAERRRYQRTNTDKMLAESDKWLHKSVDAEHAARELRNELFMRGLRYGDQHP